MTIKIIVFIMDIHKVRAPHGILTNFLKLDKENNEL